MQTTKMSPLGDRLVVRPLDAEDQTAGGLYVPDSAKEKPVEAIVLAVGPGRFNEMTGARMPISVAVGDRVLYTKYAGSEFLLNDETVLLIEESDVVAVLS